MRMAANTTLQGRHTEPVRQFSLLTTNRLGWLHELISVLASREIHVLALTVLDNSDSSILRMVVDDPDRTRELLQTHAFPFTEATVLVVEIDSTTELMRLMSALLQAELKINYLYSFIPHPGGKSLLALNMEDLELGEQALQRGQFRTLRQSDISR